MWRFKLVQHLSAAALVLVGTMAVLFAPQAYAQSSQRDLATPARQAVNQVLYASTATSAAAERALDARINEQRSAIEALRGRITQAGGRSEALATELATEQERFVTALAELDRAYAQEIAILRGAAEDIASTPEGLAALERFNANDELGALLILDRLREAREHARQVRNNIESAAEARDIATLALEARDRGRLDTNAVIARYVEVVSLDPGQFWDWSSLSSLHRNAGDLAAAAAAAERAFQLAGDDNQRAAAASIAGQVQQEGGNLDAAAVHFERSLTLTRRLNTTAPNRYNRRSLSLSLNLLAEVLTHQGTPERALLLLRESESIMRALLRARPADAGIQRDLSVTLGHVARALQQQDRLQEAARTREEIVAIDRGLASRESGPGQAQRDLAVAITGVGETAERQGDRRAALERYRESVVIFRRLVAADENALHLYDLANVLDRIGQLLWLQGAAEEAAQVYSESFEVMERLTTVAPGSSDAQHGMAVSRERMGDIAAQQRDFSRAEVHYAASVEISRNLVANAPTMIRYSNTLANALENFGAMRVDQRRYADALAMFEEAQQIRERVIAVDQTAEQNRALAATRLNISTTMRKIGEVAAAQGNLADAARDFNDSLRIVERLIVANPSDADLLIAKAAILNLIGDLQRDHAQPTAAAATYAAMLQTTVTLLERQPQNPRFQHDVGLTIERLMALQPQGARLADVRALLTERQTQGTATESDRLLLARLQGTGRLSGLWRGAYVQVGSVSQVNVQVAEANASQFDATADYLTYSCAVAWEAQSSSEGRWQVSETVTENQQACIDSTVDLILVPDGAIYAEYHVGARLIGVVLLHAAVTESAEHVIVH